MGLFGGGKKKTKSKTTQVQTLAPNSLAIQSILARYLLQRMQNLSTNPQTFGAFRTQGPQMFTGPTAYPSEATSIPGLSEGGVALPSVNPILNNPSLFRKKSK